MAKIPQQPSSANYAAIANKLQKAITLGLFGFSCVIFAAGILFSSVGNGIIASFLVSKLSTLSHIQWQSKTFQIRPHRILIELTSPKLHMILRGKHWLFFQSDIDFFIFSQTNNPNELKEDFYLQGKLNGNPLSYSLYGKNDWLALWFELHGNYAHIDFSLYAHEASLAQLTKIFGSAYGDGIVDFVLNGNEEGLLNYRFNIHGGYLPQHMLSPSQKEIAYALQTQGSLTHQSSNIQAMLYSTQGNLKLNGIINFEPLDLDLSYQIKNTSLPMAQGKIQGDWKQMHFYQKTHSSSIQCTIFDPDTLGFIKQMYVLALDLTCITPSQN